MIAKRLGYLVKYNVRAVDAFELVYEVRVIYTHDEVRVTNDPPLGVEQVNLLVDVGRAFAFRASHVWQVLSLQSIVAALASPIAPRVLGVFRVLLYEFLYNVISVKMPDRP